MARIGIAGAGLLGRLLAWKLSRAGHQVTVWDPVAGPMPTFDGRQAAAYTAAGMLSPIAEFEYGGARIAGLGWRSIEAWAGIVAALRARPAFSVAGSLLLAHRSDAGAAQRMLARLQGAPGTTGPEPLDSRRLAVLEPQVRHVPGAWYLPGEGQIDSVAAMLALQAEAPGVQWHWQRTVRDVAPGVIDVEDGAPQAYDLAFDVRGVGGRPAMPVRGVRGEIAWLHLPRHGLTRPVRLLHARHRVYLVPRPGDLLLVGASEIESEDRSPMSVQTAVELLTAAHSVMPVLAEARIVRLDVNLRPALPDNEPRIEVEAGRVRINGLHRHGWLVAPALVEEALGLAL